MDNLNRIIEGNAQYSHQLPDGIVDCIVTSPPYWGKIDYKHEDQIGDEAGLAWYFSNLRTCLIRMSSLLKPTGTLWFNIGDTYIKGVPQLIPFKIAEYIQELFNLRQVIIWEKTNARPESVTNRCSNNFEYVFFATKTQDYYYNQILEPCVTEPPKNKKDNRGFETKENVEQPHNPDRHGASINYREDGMRNARAIWKFPCGKCPDAHFATMPIDLAKRCIEAGSPPGGLVFDPFAGSGTTLVAAKELGRNYLGIELNPEYIKIAEKRLADLELAREPAYA